MTKPQMPTAELIELISEGATDYCDGDNPGWCTVTYTDGLLTLTYEPDEDTEPQFAGPYGNTVRRFREITADE